jgi:predicted exporter
VPLSTASRWLIGTVLSLGLGSALVLWQVRPTYDLAFFLPEPVTEQEAVLVERLGQGAGARLMFIEISARPGGDAAAQSTSVRDLLARSPLFLRVENGQSELSTDSIPASIWRWRHLLADTDWSAEGLRTALSERISDLATLGGPEVAQLIARDPLWVAPRVLESLQLGGTENSPRWSDGPARAFIVAETVAPPFDIAAQQLVINEVHRAYSSTLGPGTAGDDDGIELYGVGVYGARVQELIQRESQVLGLVASVAVLIIVALAYRSWRLTLLSLIPLAAAIIGGLMAASVVDDYPMHLFSHARHVSAREGVRTLFRTLLVSAGTTIVAYAALAVSGSRGLAQLGVFSLTGIACAMAVTCWVLPNLMKSVAVPPHDSTPQEFRLSARVWLPLLAAAIAFVSMSGGVHWNDNLSEVTPLPKRLLARDHEMRERFGAPDVRYLISISADSLENALERTEVLDRQLSAARVNGLLESWSAVTALLPSEATQLRRRAAIPSPDELRQRLLADAAQAREVPVIRAADLAEGFVADFVGSHLSESEGRWRSVVFLTGLAGPEKLAAWLRSRSPDATLVDLKAASESLVRGYRIRLMSVLAGATVLIAALIVWSTGSLGRFLWSAGTVAASVAFTLAVLNWLGGAVSLFHMVSLVLVAGLGVDYCLFYSRPGVSRTEFLDTRHAVIACAASTAGAFAILGTSSIPLLSSVGTTVAIGTLTMFVAARLGCRVLRDGAGT